MDVFLLIPLLQVIVTLHILFTKSMRDSPKHHVW